MKNKSVQAKDHKNDYALYRQDDNGNVFLIQKNLSRTKATDLLKEYEVRRHKQTYWIRQQLTDGKIREK